MANTNKLQMGLIYSPTFIGMAAGYAISKKYNTNKVIGVVTGLGIGFFTTLYLAFHSDKLFNNNNGSRNIQTPVGGTTMASPSV